MNHTGNLASMHRTLFVAACALLAGSASAQIIRQGGLGAKDFPFHIHVGYGKTGTFQNNLAQNVHLEGPEIGIDIPLQRPVNGGPVVMLMPSVLLGGQLSSGGDADGYVYRLQVGVNGPVGAKGFYTRFAVGYSIAQSRGGQFAEEKSFSQRYTLGYGLDALGMADKASLEVSYHNGSRNVLKGWTVGANIRF